MDKREIEGAMDQGAITGAMNVAMDQGASY